MSQPDSPRTVVATLIKGIGNRSWEELSALYDENVVVEHPFNVPAPSKINGRAELHERFRNAPTRELDLVPHDVVIRETDDPEVVVVQYDYTITVRSSGKSFETANVLVVRVRDGLILHSVDYHNHAALHAAYEAVGG